MRLFLVVALVMSIFIIYLFPTFYDAYIEYKVLKVARIIATELVSTRRKAIESNKSYGMKFIKKGKDAYKIFLDINNNNKFDSKDKVIKTVELDKLDKNVIYAGWFDDKDVVLRGDTIVFGRRVQKNTKGYDSIFLIHKRDEERGFKDRISRIHINRKNYEIKVLKVVKVTDDGSLVFGDLRS